jgi:hypothetical protein
MWRDPPPFSVERAAAGSTSPLRSAKKSLPALARRNLHFSLALPIGARPNP